MSAALTKIAKDELNKVLEGWLCDCATTEEEWDVIAEYSFERKIKIVQRDYVGGVAQFLIDAFPEIWLNWIMKIEFAKPTKFEVPVQKVWTISPKMKQWMKRRAQQIKDDIRNDDLWVKGGERAY